MVNIELKDLITIIKHFLKCLSSRIMLIVYLLIIMFHYKTIINYNIWTSTNISLWNP